MKLCIGIGLSTNVLSQDYRRLILSLMKHALHAYGGEALVEKYYGSAAPKPMTWGLYMPNPRYSGKEMTLSSAFLKLTISTDCFELFGDFYNGFNSIRRKNVEIAGVKFQVISCSIPQEKSIESEAVRVKLLTPLCVRFHKSDSQDDSYYTYEDAEFQDQLRAVTRIQLAAFGKNTALADTLELGDMCGLKRTVILHYGKYIPVTIGKVELHGAVELLEFMRQIGMGSHRNSGCGMFELEQCTTGGGA